MAVVAKYSTVEGEFYDKYPQPAEEGCDDIYQEKTDLHSGYFFVQTDGAAGKFPLGGNNKKPGGWPGEIHQYSTTDVDIEGISPGQCNRRL
ncbi:hypothetical protein [Serratia rubidaea]|uniref:hypothetical protein n=1 Tax=Serratia rubidaea TaxID=61652 RepID=UPI003FA358F2